MPTMPPSWRPPGARTRQETNREYEARRRRRDPQRGERYDSPAWRRRRAAKRRANPTCEICDALFGEVRPVQSVNHVRGWRTDQEFLHGELESVCNTCHSKITAAEQHGGVPYDGMTDKRGNIIGPGHWFYEERLAIYGPRKRRPPGAGQKSKSSR